MQHDVYVYRAPLPGKVREMVTPDTEDDGYSVYIDEGLSDEEAYEEYQHALRHIAAGHFDQDGRSADELEIEAHKKED